MSTSENINFLSEMFPSVDREVIEIMLESMEGDLDKTINVLFEQVASSDDSPPGLGDSSNAPPVVSHSELSSNPPQIYIAPPKDSHEDEDLSYAMALQAQFDSQQEPQNPPFYEEDERLARELLRDMENEEGSFMSDEALAIQLQNEMNSVSYDNYWDNKPHSSPSLSMDNPFESLDLESMLKNLDQTSVDSIVEQMKTSVIPLIQETVRKFDLPGVEESVEVPKLGPVTFGFSRVSVDKFIIPQERFNIKLDGNQVKISCLGIESSLAPFDWFYKQEKSIKLKDKGQATGTMIVDINLTLSIDINSNDGLQVVVKESKVAINKLDIKITGTKKKFLYGLLLKVVTSVVTSHLEKFLSTTLRKTVNGFIQT